MVEMIALSYVLRKEQHNFTVFKDVQVLSCNSNSRCGRRLRFFSLLLLFFMAIKIYDSNTFNAYKKNIMCLSQ